MMRSIESKVRTKLRLHVARLVQQRLREQGSITQGRRVALVPCESNSRFKEISQEVARKLSTGPDLLFVPVLMLEAGADLTIHVLRVEQDGGNDFWALPSAGIHPNSTMDRVVEVLDPSREWSLADPSWQDSPAFAQLLDLV